MWQNSLRLNNSTFRTTHRKRTLCGPQDHHQNIHDTKFRFLLRSNLTMSNTLIQASQHYLGTDHLISRGVWDFSSRRVFFSLFAQQVSFFKSKLQQDFYFFWKKHIKIRTCYAAVSPYKYSYGSL